MTPFMFGNPWLLWAWPWPDDANSQHPRPDRQARTTRTWRIFGRRRAQNPTQDQAREPSGSSDPCADLAPWPGLRLLLPLTEDELITFGRGLEDAHDVVGRLLAEC